MDFHEHCLDEEYSGEYDNLLFFYSYLHSIVNKAKTSAGKCWSFLWMDNSVYVVVQRKEFLIHLNILIYKLVHNDVCVLL